MTRVKMIKIFMETGMAATTASVRSPRGYRWIPTMHLEPGMVIAKPILGRSGMQATIHLAVGSAVTASTIAQLVNKGVECVAILQGGGGDEAAYADILRQYESRLHEIFGPEPDRNCRPLLDALLSDGP
jgi:hypothetical protein